MVDPGRLRSLLDRLGGELAGLRRLAALPPEELAADPDRLPAVKYRMIVAIEACIDAAEHIIASERLRAPETFADAFTVLGEAGILPDDLARTLEDMARFRNLLVHGYARVDDRRVEQILRTRLGELERARVTLSRAAGSGPPD
jgi:uncharacterized protein YutE (UPF0331/DUF86 family)